MKLIHKEVKTLVIDHVRTGSDFRRWREGIGITAQTLSVEAGFNHAHVGKLERGKRAWTQVDMDWLVKVAKEIIHYREKSK